METHNAQYYKKILETYANYVYSKIGSEQTDGIVLGSIQGYTEGILYELKKHPHTDEATQ